MTKFGALNYVNVGAEGTFRPSGNLTTKPVDIDALFSHLEQTNTTKLVIHFHGGLVKEGAGLEIARKMTPLYADAGSHPVTFIWETGLVETITRNLTNIHGTKLFQKLLKYVIRHAAKHLGGEVGGKGPGEIMTMSEIEEELARAGAFDSYDAGARGGVARLEAADVQVMRDEIEAELSADLDADDDFQTLFEKGVAETEYLAPSVESEVVDKEARGVLNTITFAKILAKVTYKVLKRYMAKRDHGFYPTVVEEVLHELYLADFGAWVWAGMKDVAEQMWRPNADPMTERAHVGTYFLERLADHEAAHAGFVIDLVGHSAGSIAICYLFRAAAQSHLHLTVRNVIFLAPACTSVLFHNEIVSHPERFADFRMFTMSDAYETQDRLVSGVYTRSLLYFISGALEEEADFAIAGLERHMTGDAPYDSAELVAAAAWLKAPRENRLVLSKTDAASPGLASASFAHGDFDDDPVTRDSLKTIIAA